MATDPTTVGCETEIKAIDLYNKLKGTAATIPVLDLGLTQFNTPDIAAHMNLDGLSVEIPDVTTGVIDGSGAFDKFMGSVNQHIEAQFDARRITSDEFAQVYTASINTVLQNGVQFALSKDQAKWSAQQAKSQALLAHIEVGKAKVSMERIKAETALAFAQLEQAQASMALTKIQLVNEDAKNCLINEQIKTAKYQNTYMLPLQKAGLEHDNVTKIYNNTHILPANKLLLEDEHTLKISQTMKLDRERELINSQKESIDVDILTKHITRDTILPFQRLLVMEQVNVQRAQTYDTRVDINGSNNVITGATVSGSILTQKNLQKQQVTSYQHEAQRKLADMYSNVWTVMRSTNNAINPPSQTNEANFNSLLSTMRSNVLNNTTV
jgi:hypothetical protein